MRRLRDASEMHPCPLGEALQEYLRSCKNMITKYIERDKDNTFTSLQKLRKNKDIVIL